MMPVQPGTSEIHDKTRFGQPLLEVLARLRFVFDNQNFHVESMICRITVRAALC
jgi:hypothetical protein